jgi:phosphoribosylformimino-5-aminoimidazole carboxamide ribotide isomerase
MRVVPVLDLMDGVVVRGVAGQRQDYRPVVSRLTTSSQPLDVARAFREHLGLEELYLADLDAIAGHPPAVDVYSRLREEGFRLWVDAGLRVIEDAEPLAAAEVETLVAGLETLAGPAILSGLVTRYSSQRIVFSLDLRAGLPLGTLDAWNTTAPWALAERAVSCGVQRVLVLDLTRVGVGQGTGTEELCRRLREGHPSLDITAGGGIRGTEDLRSLSACGVTAVLVASALHDGRLTHADLDP